MFGFDRIQQQLDGNNDNNTDSNNDNNNDNNNDSNNDNNNDSCWNRIAKYFGTWINENSTSGVFHLNILRLVISIPYPDVATALAIV